VRFSCVTVDFIAPPECPSCEGPSGTTLPLAYPGLKGSFGPFGRTKPIFTIHSVSYIHRCRDEAPSIPYTGVSIFQNAEATHAPVQ